MRNVTMTTDIHAFHIIAICPLINMPASLHMCVPLQFYCIPHIDPTFLHTSVKMCKLQQILNKLLQNMSKKQICLSNGIYMPHAQST